MWSVGPLRMCQCSQAHMHEVTFRSQEEKSQLLGLEHRLRQEFQTQVCCCSPASRFGCCFRYCPRRRRRQRTPAGIGIGGYMHGICTMHCRCIARCTARCTQCIAACCTVSSRWEWLAGRTVDCWPTPLACSTAQVQAEQMSNEELRFRLETLQVVWATLQPCQLSGLQSFG